MAQTKKVTIVRGAFANPFELQNYYPLASKFSLKLITSKNPLSENIDLPTTKLWSPTDLPNFPFKYPLINRAITDIHYLKGLENNIKGSDIVHVAETYYHYTHQAILAKQKHQIGKVVSTVWEIIPHNNEGIRGRKDFKKTAYEQVDMFICITNKARIALIEEGVDPDKICVIPMGIDLKRFSPQKDKADFRLLTVARLVKEKGIDTLIDAYKHLKKLHPNLKLTIIGSGPLTNKAISAGIDVKTVPYSQIHQEYAQASIFVHPATTTKTWQEQFGMSLVEAMGCGLPIVTTDTGAIGEVVGDAAIYFQDRDVKSLVAKLDNVIKGTALVKTLSTLSRKRAEMLYDSSKISARIERVYQNL